MRYVQVCTQLRKLQFLQKIGKIVESMKTCLRGPQQGLRFLRKLRQLRELQFLRKIGKIVESMETCQRVPTMYGISAISAKITIFAKNWKNRRVDVNMSKRAPTRSAISAKTARIGIIVKSAEKWKNRRVSEKLSNRRLRGLQ